MAVILPLGGVGGHGHVMDNLGAGMQNPSEFSKIYWNFPILVGIPIGIIL